MSPRGQGSDRDRIRNRRWTPSDTESATGLNPEHLRMVEALLFAAVRAAGRKGAVNIAAAKARTCRPDGGASSGLMRSAA